MEPNAARENKLAVAGLLYAHGQKENHHSGTQTDVECREIDSEWFN
jgi:hypothetical protein